MAAQVKQLYAEGGGGSRLRRLLITIRRQDDCGMSEPWHPIRGSALIVLGCSTGSKNERFAHSIADVDLGWFEEVFPPGNAALVAELRRRAPMPIAMAMNREVSIIPRRSWPLTLSTLCGSISRLWAALLVAGRSSRSAFG